MSKVTLASMKALNLYTARLRRRIEEGQIIGVKSENKDFIWHSGEWHEYVAPKVEMSVYDMNEQLARQLITLTQEQLDQKVQEICKWDKEQSSSYYMLLCKEESYFTMFCGRLDLFEKTDEENLGVGVVNVLKEIGEIKSIDLLEDNTFEIWLCQFETEKMWCLHLFNYSAGVITFGYEK